MLLSNLNLLATAPNGVARLRELILTLAVQGKLVPQDASDEPARELLKKIRAEKDRLIAEGKIKRDKPLAEIEEEEKPFELPATWEWVRFGEILDFQGGGQPPKSNFSDVPLPDYVQLIQIRDLGDKPQPVYIPRNLGAKFCTPADVMVGRYGASVGKVFWGKEGAYNVALVKMVDAYQAFDAKFLYQFLVSPVGQSLFAGISRSAQDGFNKNDIEPKLIPLPPLAEQSRIVNRVEELMRLCDALQAKARVEATQHEQLARTLLASLTAPTVPNATPQAQADPIQASWHRVATHFDLLLDRPEAVDALEQTILQLAVRGLLLPQDPKDEPASELLKKIRTEKDRLIAEGKIKRDKPLPPIGEEEKPFGLPKGWEWARFGQVVLISSGVTLGRKTSIPSPVSLPYLRVANVQRWSLKLASMKEVVIDSSELDRFQLNQGDLLITEGGDWDKVGRTAIWRDELPTCLHQNHVFKARGTSAEWNPVWAEMYLNSAIARTYFASSAKQTTNLASINMTQLKDCAFPLPPLAEQSRIVARVASLRALCANLRQRLTTARTQQALLAEVLVSG